MCPSKSQKSWNIGTFGWNLALVQDSHRPTSGFVCHASVSGAARIWTDLAEAIAQNSTYRHAQNEVNENGQDHWVLLQAHYGPEPSWTTAQLDSSIPAICQTLHAVDTDGGSFSIAVVRDTESDYPLVICTQSLICAN
jgi:hypothetical protein